MRKLDVPSEEEMKALKAKELEILAEREENARNIPVGTTRASDSKHRAIEARLFKTRQRMKQISAEERQKLISEIKELKKERNLLPSMDNFDPDFKRMRYVRYADDFLIGIIGERADAENIKSLLTAYLDKELKLELSQEKTYITHNHDKVRFLGYDIFIQKPTNDRIVAVTHNSGRPVKRRTLTGGVKLSIPHEKLKDFIVGKGYAKDIGNGTWKATHRPALINNEAIEIVMQCNAEFRGFYQYYKLAFDVREKLINAHWIWQKSVTKTLAGKYKTKVSKLMNKEIEVNGIKYKELYRNGIWGATHVKKNGKEKFIPIVQREEIQFVKEIFQVDPQVNILPKEGIYYGRTSIIQRLNAETCEICGDNEGPFEVHHVRKLSDLKKKKHLQKWEKFLIARNRKTVVLCGHKSKNNCHLKLHNGKID